MKTLKELKVEFGENLDEIEKHDDYISLACNFIRMVMWKKLRDLDYIAERYTDLIPCVILDIKHNGYENALDKIKLGNLHKAYNLAYMRNYYGITMKENEKYFGGGLLDDDFSYKFPIGKVFVKDIDKKTSVLAGTSIISENKIKSGSVAEIKVLKHFDKIGIIVENVADDTKYHFDILLREFNLGLEVKNVENGSFFISENEIRRYENGETVLCFVDQNDLLISKRFDQTTTLKNVISDIREIDSYIIDKYQSWYKAQGLEIKWFSEFQDDFIIINRLNKEQIIKIILDK